MGLLWKYKAEREREVAAAAERKYRAEQKAAIEASIQEAKGKDERKMPELLKAIARVEGLHPVWRVNLKQQSTGIFEAEIEFNYPERWMDS